MEKLANEQAKLGKAIDACMDNYYKDGKARKTHDYFNRRLKKLEDLWCKFYENHQNLLTLQATNPNHAYFKEDFFSQVETTYEDLKSELEANIRKGEDADNQETSPSGDTADELNRQIRKQEALLASLERAIQNAREGIQTPQSRAFYQQHLTNLREYWSTINKNHHDLMADDDSSKYDIEKYTAIEIQYQEISIKLLELSDIQPSPNLSSNHQSQLHQHQSMVRSQKLQFPFA